jgi:hypothetical protein
MEENEIKGERIRVLIKLLNFEIFRIVFGEECKSDGEGWYLKRGDGEG